MPSWGTNIPSPTSKYGAKAFVRCMYPIVDKLLNLETAYTYQWSRFLTFILIYLPYFSKYDQFRPFYSNLKKRHILFSKDDQVALIRAYM